MKQRKINKKAILPIPGHTNTQIKLVKKENKPCKKSSPCLPSAAAERPQSVAKGCVYALASFHGASLHTHAAAWSGPLWDRSPHSRAPMPSIPSRHRLARMSERGGGLAVYICVEEGGEGTVCQSGHFSGVLVQAHKGRGRGSYGDSAMEGWRGGGEVSSFTSIRSVGTKNKIDNTSNFHRRKQRNQFNDEPRFE